MTKTSSSSSDQPQAKSSQEAGAQAQMEENSSTTESLLSSSKPGKAPSLWKGAIIILFIVVLIGMTSAAYSNFFHTDEDLETTTAYVENFQDTVSKPNEMIAKLIPHNDKLFIDDVDKITDLSIRLKRNIIQSSSLTEQTFPLLASLAVKDLMLSHRAPLDLVCVLDHSGSMQGEKMELVKNTFKYLLHFLNEFDRLSIVIFDDQVSTIVPLINTNDANKKRILSAISTVHDRGGTNINLGVQRALEILKERKEMNVVTSIFLLSDGLDNRHGAQYRIKDTLANSGLQDSIVIHTFGFGRDHDPQLMTDIADITDGSFYFIKKLDNIDEAFVESLGALQSSVAKSVQITVRPEQSEVLQGVKLVKAYGDATMWAQNGQSYITKTTYLMHGRQKDYVLELKIPTISKKLEYGKTQVKVASVEALINLPDNSQLIKKADLIITLLNEEEEFRYNEEDDREVMKNYFRVKGALLMDEARQMSDEGGYEVAKKILQDFKEGVENSFLKEERFIKDMIKDLENAIKYVEPEEYEKYGRHNLIGNQRAQIRQQSNLDLSTSVHLTNTHLAKNNFVLAAKKDEELRKRIPNQLR